VPLVPREAIHKDLELTEAQMVNAMMTIRDQAAKRSEPSLTALIVKREADNPLTVYDMWSQINAELGGVWRWPSKYKDEPVELDSITRKMEIWLHPHAGGTVVESVLGVSKVVVHESHLQTDYDVLMDSYRDYFK
jgi:hypothetical protein